MSTYLTSYACFVPNLACQFVKSIVWVRVLSLMNKVSLALHAIRIGVPLNKLVIFRINGLWYVYATHVWAYFVWCHCVLFGVSCL